MHIVDPQSLSFGNVSDKLLRESFWCVLMGVRGIDQPADVDSWEQTVEQTERFSDTVAMAGQMKPDRSTGRANQRMRVHGFQHRLSPCRKSIISIVPRVVSHRDSLRHHDDMWVSF